MVDFAAEGLLDGVEGAAREARLRLLTELSEQGVGLDELRQAVDENSLVFLPAERLIGGDARYSGLEVAELAGVEIELMAALRRANGVPLPEPDVRAYTEADLEAARMARTFLDAGLRGEDMVEVTRILGRALSQAADVMTSMTLDLVLEGEPDEHRLATEYAGAASALEPLLAPLLGSLLNAHLRRVVRAELLSVLETRGRVAGARDVSVCFADVVGFTSLGERSDPAELGAVAERLEAMTGDLCVQPVRLVKTIGDAVMLVAPHADPLLDAALELVARAEAEQDFPQLRAGVACGPALQRAGDWYGRPVNLASRVTGAARPGSVLVTEEIREAASDDGRRFSFAGERSLKGVPGAVKLWRARAESVGS